MRRRLFTLMAAISLLLCVATVVLWVRSYLTLDEVRRFTHFIQGAGGFDRGVESSSGVIYGYKKGWVLAADPHRASHWVWGSRLPDYWLGQSQTMSLALLVRRIQIGGYGVAYAADENGIVEVVLRIPYWPLAVLFAFLPAIWFWSWMGGTSRIHSHCRKCGYNLTGNTSGTCPECGTPVAGKAKGVA